ncbi:MAG: hypothetical protein BGN99_26215 [Alphaproteobacteria bacterium 65-37]|nr:MAG: hypothetical protein BGN99_26215 [Alphaproteobacteria bacterium 65-37]
MSASAAKPVVAGAPVAGRKFRLRWSLVLPLGWLLLVVIFNRDLILVQGTVSFIAAAFVIINFLVDMLYAVLDPRVRHVRFRS